MNVGSHAEFDGAARRRFYVIWKTLGGGADILPPPSVRGLNSSVHRRIVCQMTFLPITSHIIKILLRKWYHSVPLEQPRRMICNINPRTDGEGADIHPPLRFFPDSVKTAGRSAAKFNIDYFEFNMTFIAHTTQKCGPHTCKGQVTRSR